MLDGDVDPDTEDDLPARHLHVWGRRGGGGRVGIIINLCLTWKEAISFHEGCSRDSKDSFCVLRLIDDKNFAWKNGNKATEGPGQENVGTEHSLCPQTSLKAKNMIPSLRREGKWHTNVSYCKDVNPFCAISLPEELIKG